MSESGKDIDFIRTDAKISFQAQVILLGILYFLLKE